MPRSRTVPIRLPEPLSGVARRVGLETQAVAALLRAGALGASSPGQALAILAVLRDFGLYGGAARIAALRHPDAPAIADDAGELSYRELDAQVNRLANAWLASGLEPRASIGILCRNGRWPLIASFAASRAGLNTVWLNSGFSPPQAAEVAAREGIDVLVHDPEFADHAARMEPARGAIATTGAPGDDTLEAMVRTGDPRLPPAPTRPGRIVLLTSGTTGTPKGAPRPEPKSLVLPGSVLARLPMRAGETTILGPPLFHGTGVLLALLSLSLGSRLVLRARFDATQFLADTESYHATTWCVVPIMLQRVLALGPEAIARYDHTSLKAVFSAGSQLPVAVAQRAQEVFGEVVYNLYGSTEVAVATLATPEDVRDAPASVGRPALGSTVRILDAQGEPLEAGEIGRIFVASTIPFEGYTGGGGKEIVDGLMSTGDLGHFDAAGRLYIDGRDDEMIVSGGENVFPREVEELLATHPAIIEAAAVGVEDPEFGQRLAAFVVPRAGEQITGEEVQAFVKANLARYKVPREVVFLPELPRNPTGKILKRQLVNPD